MTPAQKTAFAADVAADGALNQLPHNSDSAFAIASAYNALATPAYYVFASRTSADAILDAITWANLTPSDAADGTAAFTNRALVCQAKQFNLSIILQGRTDVASGKTSVRQGLSDALQNVPSGAGGALLDAGWAGAGKVKAAITRQASRIEKLFATGNGTTATPSNLVYDGQIGYQEVLDALGW